ncbi:N-acetylneuraminate synthase [Devosia sp. Root635]|uniref:N-acetylneuraminate synthase n=1 Tax=Devosia sp. Root635 TaxID=1736575 RepID=UPI0006F58FB5|nr:N-acetylneuraminate synthase [Devosia sp. Root635]KRA55357.1 N-acetylneuraminate synthase [Devosia sp. Root635]
MSTFVIAEAGVNHNGQEDLALALVDAAAASGADAVKFQTFSAEKLTRRGAEKADYQKRSTGDGDQFQMLSALEMSHELHHAILLRCTELGIEFMSTGFDEDALDFLVSLGIRRIKVPSGEITNLPFLEHIAAKNLPVIVSTGMATMDEVVRAVDTIAEARAKNGFVEPLSDILTVLHCTSNYPTLPADVNLRAMQSIADMTGLPVGYSDHTLGLAVATGAVALGATVIEKHFTLDKLLPGPDHGASLDPRELADLVRQIRDIEVAMGSPVKAPTDSELPVRALVRKSVTAISPIPAGHPITREAVALLRPGSGIPPSELAATLGRTAARDIAAGETLTQNDLV